MPRRRTAARRSPLANFFYRLVKEQPLGLIGGLIVLVLLLVGIFADQLAQYGENEINPRARLQLPHAEHWLGTDNLGRDLYTRIVYGARVSLVIGLSATAVFPVGRLGDRRTERLYRRENGLDRAALCGRLGGFPGVAHSDHGDVHARQRAVADHYCRGDHFWDRGLPRCAQYGDWVEGEHLHRVRPGHRHAAPPHLTPAHLAQYYAPLDCHLHLDARRG